MTPSLTFAMDIVERFHDAASAADTGHYFYETLRPWGLRAIYARAYSSRATNIATEALAKNQHLYARISPGRGGKMPIARGGARQADAP